MNKKLVILIVVILIAIVGCVVFFKKSDSDVPIIKDDQTSQGTSETSGENQSPLKESKVVTLTKENYQQEVVNSTKTVIIEFTAPWSEECLIQDPILDALSLEYEQVKIARVDTDAEPELKEFYGITAVPTIAVVKGESIEKLYGVVSKDKLVDLINK